MPARSALSRAASAHGRNWTVLVALVVCAAGCTRAATPVETLSEQDIVLAYVDAGIDTEVADCLVGLGSREFDVEQLLPGSLDGEDALLLDELTRSCRDAVAALSEVDLEERENLGVGPFNVGDDEYLDDLWFGCESGRGADCDRLWEEAPIGSVYESFGVTCGNRPEILDCTIEMDGPDRTPEGAR